ncbi:MAG: DNA double-strand break repair nuclease NurA, partial [Methanothrix sp.]
MEDESRLTIVAELIRDHISLEGIDRYLAETGVQSRDFVVVEPCDYAGEIFAVDGSNVSICSWSAANVNLIRAGYAVYQGRVWKRTVITFDDVLLADAKLCRNMFDPYLEQFFGLEGIDLKESDLDRLSSYYRELQEYVAINDALGEAHAGDIILYDGSFDVFELLRGVLATIFARARKKGVALLAVAKSSSLFWGEEISLPFVQHTSMAGSRL